MAGPAPSPSLSRSRNSGPVGTMRCPFCAEEILDEASVCRYCGNALLIPEALKVENEELKQQVLNLEMELNELRQAQAQRRRTHGKVLRPAQDQ